MLEKGQSDLETAIVDAKDGIVTTKAEIEALDDVIKAALETQAQPEAQPQCAGDWTFVKELGGCSEEDIDELNKFSQRRQ